MVGSMADLFAAAHRTAGAGVRGRRRRADVDPVVRPSDRADAQANGALALAKRLGRNPREVAADIVAAADLDGVASAGDRRAWLHQPDRRYARCSAAMLADVATDARLGDRPGREPPLPRRLLGPERRQGAAHRPPAQHRHRRRAWSACSTFLGHEVVRENHIGDWGRPFGILIEQLVETGARGRRRADA